MAGPFRTGRRCLLGGFRTASTGYIGRAETVPGQPMGFVAVPETGSALFLRNLNGEGHLVTFVMLMCIIFSLSGPFGA